MFIILYHNPVEIIPLHACELYIMSVGIVSLIDDEIIFDVPQSKCFISVYLVSIVMLHGFDEHVTFVIIVVNHFHIFVE